MELTELLINQGVDVKVNRLLSLIGSFAMILFLSAAYAAADLTTCVADGGCYIGVDKGSPGADLDLISREAGIEANTDNMNKVAINMNSDANMGHVNLKTGELSLTACTSLARPETAMENQASRIYRQSSWPYFFIEPG